MIRIEQRKRRKDRYVMLSPYVRAVLQEYEHAVHPTTVLFPSRAGGGPLSPRRCPTHLAPLLRLDDPARSCDMTQGRDLLAMAGGTAALTALGQRLCRWTSENAGI